LLHDFNRAHEITLTTFCCCGKFCSSGGQLAKFTRPCARLSATRFQKSAERRTSRQLFASGNYLVVGC
jgi:hypothetical protein